jgi:hypothetical protein
MMTNGCRSGFGTCNGLVRPAGPRPLSWPHSAQFFPGTRIRSKRSTRCLEASCELLLVSCD